MIERNDKTSLAAIAFPWLVLVLCGLYVARQAAPVKIDSPFPLAEFGTLPVSHQGRIKPLDSVARTNLTLISGRSYLELDGQKHQAIEWFADMWTNREKARDEAVFRIDNRDVLTQLGLEDNDAKRFSYNQISAKRGILHQQVQQALAVPQEHRNPYQRHILNLANRVSLYELTESWERIFYVPPVNADADWMSHQQVIDRYGQEQDVPFAAEAIAVLHGSLVRQDPDRFTNMLVSYQGELMKAQPKWFAKARYETFFQRFAPFYQSMTLYVLAFVLIGFSWLFWATPLRRAAILVLLLAAAIHTFGLASRMYLMERPPVTNLYSSAVFIGWIAVLVSLGLERLSRNGIGAVVAAIAGFATLLVAAGLDTGKDNMEMLQAVLDTNFWLATHVVCITIGYSATYLAGLLAIVFIFLGVFTTKLDKAMEKELARMVYGTICFALLFSFVGTILGGIWADQSWGRFWGWDPKENGALIIVLWNALILHARWGGVVQNRGIMNLAVFGNVVTAWSWFGTNMLGVGFHSYGFIDSAVFWMAMFIASQLLVIAVGSLPHDLWRSYRARIDAQANTKSDPRVLPS